MAQARVSPINSTPSKLFSLFKVEKFRGKMIFKSFITILILAANQISADELLTGLHFRLNCYKTLFCVYDTKNSITCI